MPPALDVAALRPGQVARMTPHDIRLAIEAGVKQRQWAHELAAWQVMHVVNATGRLRRRVTMDDLLGPAWTLQRIRRQKTEPE